MKIILGNQEDDTFEVERVEIFDSAIEGKKDIIAYDAAGFVILELFGADLDNLILEGKSGKIEEKKKKRMSLEERIKILEDQVIELTSKS